MAATGEEGGVVEGGKVEGGGSQKPANGAFDLDAFMGKWYIVQSTLKMWKTGKKTGPSLEYTKTAPDRWDDVVMYDQAGWSKKPSAKKIHGKDMQTGKEKGPDFVWTGTGLLRLIKCHCKVIDSDEGMKEWAVVKFGKTLFTEDGIDIYSRKEEPFSEEKLKEILERIKVKDGIEALLTKRGLEKTHSTNTNTEATATTAATSKDEVKDTAQASKKEETQPTEEAKPAEAAEEKTEEEK